MSVVGFGLLPVAGQQLVEAMGGVAVDAAQDVLDVDERVDGHGPAGLHQREQDAGGVAAALAAGEEPVLPFMSSSA